MTARSEWWCTGPRWREGRAGLGWYADGRGERWSGLGGRAVLAFVAEGERRCLGVWRAGRRTACPVEAPVPARGIGAQCAECARLDRSYSVAADTRAEDPQPYAVYLAYFGPGLLKVGITAAARGPARLLEQGAVAFSRLGLGPLMAARRAEELLGAALGVRDRIPYADKRAVRLALPPAVERVGELAALYDRAAGLDGWPESLARTPFEPVDHSGVFGLDRLEQLQPASGPGRTGRPEQPDGADAGPPVPGVAASEVTALADGAVVAGGLLGAAGPDLHLRTPQGLLFADSRLMAGWRLAATDADRATTAPVRALRAVRGAAGPAAAPQDGLF